MAPTVSSKGKAKSGSKASAAPRSRNTTPLPNVRTSVEPPSASSYFSKPLSSYLKKCDVTVEEILESGGSSSQIPSGSRLLSMRDQIEKTVLKNVESRCTQSEGALRELQSLRKNRVPREREREKEKDSDDRERKHKLKKVSKKHDEDGKHPPTTGAHGVARQDGGDGKGASSLVTSHSPCFRALLTARLARTWLRVGSAYDMPSRSATISKAAPHDLETRETEQIANSASR